MTWIKQNPPPRWIPVGRNATRFRLMRPRGMRETAEPLSVPPYGAMKCNSSETLASPRGARNPVETSLGDLA